MKTKIDIQLELIHEINQICSQNNLNYILFEVDGINPYHKVKKGNSSIISIAMTQGDIERFCKIIGEKHSKSRYVEGIFNNPKYNPIYISYGNKNTTEIPILKISHKKCYGIEIIIHPINKSANLDGKKIKGLSNRLLKEKKIRTTMNKRIENHRFWYVKTGLKIFNSAYSITGGGKRYLKEIMKNIGIDKWDDIKNYSEVSINEFDINTKELIKIKKIKIKEYSYSVTENTADFFINSIEKKLELANPMNFKSDKIIHTEIGYEQILNETEDILREAKATNEEIAWRKLKVKNEQNTIRNVWKIVEMTNVQIQFINYFKDRIDYLSGLNLSKPDEFNEVYKEIKPIITELKKYAKLNLTFSVDEKTDKLIEDILIKKGEDKFLETIKTLQNQEYLIE